MSCPRASPSQQIALAHRTHHLGRHHGRLGADDRHLRHAVLAEDGDGRLDRLVGVHVDELGHDGALAVQHVADRRPGRLRREEAVVGHPAVVEDLRQIAPAAVGQQDDHDGIRAGLLGDLARRDDGHAARSADEEPLLPGQASGHQEAVAVGHRDDLIRDRAVIGRRPEVLADALDEVGTPAASRVHGPLGIGPDDPHPPVADLLQVATGAGDGAAGADTGDEVGHAPVGLLPDLGPGRRLVRARVVEVGVLVGLPRVRRLAHESVRHRVVRVRVIRVDGGRAHHDLARRRRAAPRSCRSTPCRGPRRCTCTRGAARRWPGRCRCCRWSARR